MNLKVTKIRSIQFKIFHKTIFRSGTNLGPFPAMASAVPSQGQQLQPPPSVVPGDSIADSYDPAQVRAANLSRAEALMSQQQRQLPQQQQPSPNTVIQQQHQFQQQVYTKPTGSFHSWDTFKNPIIQNTYYQTFCIQNSCLLNISVSHKIGLYFSDFLGMEKYSKTSI